VGTDGTSPIESFPGFPLSTVRLFCCCYGEILMRQS